MTAKMDPSLFDTMYTFTTVPSTLFVLYFLFLNVQLYALVIHFPTPKTGTVSPIALLILKGLTAGLVLITWTPITQVKPPFATPIVAPAYVGFLASTALFLWTAYTTQPGRFSIAYGRVSPKFVVTDGPFRYIRHPTYVSYALGWFAAIYSCVVVVVFSGQKINTWIPQGTRSWVMIGMIASLCGCYSQAARLEERQFLEGKEVVNGQEVTSQISKEYKEFVDHTTARWIPGVI
jgi:protein-S-isoprenylcysteine O-methyltransferase Ste14